MPHEINVRQTLWPDIIGETEHSVQICIIRHRATHKPTQKVYCRSVLYLDVRRNHNNRNQGNYPVKAAATSSATCMAIRRLERGV